MKSDVEINAAVDVLNALAEIEDLDSGTIDIALAVLNWVKSDSGLTSLKGILDNEVPTL